MKKIKISCFASLAITTAFSPSFATLSVGSLAFIGFNTDEGDDFAVVALDNIENETIFFTDTELVGDGSFVSPGGEGILQWETGIIAAGTVITFSDVNTAALLTSSLGTFTETDAGFSFASTDSIFAFQGSLAAPTLLAGLGVGETSDLTGSGLTLGTTHLEFSGAVDGGQYIGPRNIGTQTFDNFLPLIGDIANNFATDNTDGEAFLPFDTTQFNGTLVPEPSAYALITGLLVCGFLFQRRVRR